MAIIERGIFRWQDVNVESDLKRLEYALNVMPDEGLMRALEDAREKGRDDYPVRAVWNSVIAGIVYGHVSIESLRRELKRNGELRDICGFDVLKGINAVPSASAYTRFLKKLLKHEDAIKGMFNKMVSELTGLLPDFGEKLVIDSKGIDSHGKPNKNVEHDGRREMDADWGCKTYKGKKEDGGIWEKVKKWFGYKVHIVADSEHELPVAYKVTKASRSDSPELLPLVKQIQENHGKLLERTKELSGDRGYDSTENDTKLMDTYGIKPVIDIRCMWKDGEKTRILNPDKADNIVYDEKGVVYCHCPIEGTQREMAFMGYEDNRKSLKYRCPAANFGYECKGMNHCGGKCGEYGRIVRIPLDTDRRIFTAIARSSYAWKRAYKNRTAVERVNSRLDVSFGFERHFIRGMKKMKLRVGLAMLVMVSMAVGHIKAGRREDIRSLVYAGT